MTALPFFDLALPAPSPHPSEEIAKVAGIFARAADRHELNAEDLLLLMNTAPRLVTLIAKYVPGAWGAAGNERRWRNLMRKAEAGELTTDLLYRAIG